MALNRASRFLKCRGILKLNFSTSFCLNNTWRLEKGLEKDPRKFSPLTILPDYSFVDGRPTPFSLHKKQKLDLQKKYLQKIIELNNEIDVGLQHKRNKESKHKKKMDESEKTGVST